MCIDNDNRDIYIPSNYKANVLNINYSYLYTADVAFNAILLWQALHNYKPFLPERERERVREREHSGLITKFIELLRCSPVRVHTETRGCSERFNKVSYQPVQASSPDQLIKHAPRYIQPRHDSIPVVFHRTLFPREKGASSFWPPLIAPRYL